MCDRGREKSQPLTTGAEARSFIASSWLSKSRGCWARIQRLAELVFETRDPAKRAWHEWNRAASYKVTEIEGVGAVESWVQVIDVSRPVVTFRWTGMFGMDGQQLTSDSALRFRERDEVEATLVAHGYAVKEVRGAPDRPGRKPCLRAATGMRGSWRAAVDSNQLPPRYRTAERCADKPGTFRAEEPRGPVLSGVP